VIAPFRIGTTSFVYCAPGPAPWLASAQRLAGRVDDVEILLFEPDTGVPDDAELAALAALKPAAGLSYTVHTPSDVSLASEDAARRAHAIDQVCRVIELTRPLAPEAYIVHVYLGDREQDTRPADLAAWRRRAASSLAAIVARGTAPASIAIETLDYEFSCLEPVVAELGLSVAIDLGHLDRDARTERALIERNLPRTRAIQWHGVDPTGRDHRSLAHYPVADARWMIDLLKERYRGVVTLEVFRDADFEESLAVLHRLLEGAP
jgi:sugar phosphate isomerase/epimerase